MIKALTSGVLVAALCAVVAAGAFAAAPSPAAPIGNSCTTLLPDSLFASVFPAYNGQVPKLVTHSDDPQVWDTTTRETWKVGTASTSGPISFTHTLPGTSSCWWFHNQAAAFHVWYSQSAGDGRGLHYSSFKAGFAASPTKAWDLYSSGAGPSGSGHWITNGKTLCPGGTPADGYDQRECATQAVNGIGDRAAEGFGYIAWQQKGNTYEIGSYNPTPGATSSRTPHSKRSPKGRR
jgi:hypothetical protein